MTRAAAQPDSTTESGPRFPPPPQGQWTYADYVQLPDNHYGRRYEVIDGNLYMSPSPTWMHQHAAGNLYAMLRDHLQPRGGRAAIALLDLLIEDIATPVQPDVIAVSKERLHIFREHGWLEGVPDLLAEVLSPSNPGHDEKVKFDAYFRAGVPEYWILDPADRTIRVHVRRGELWAPIGFTMKDVAKSEVFPGFEAPVQAIFA